MAWLKQGLSRWLAARRLRSDKRFLERLKGAPWLPPSDASQFDLALRPKVEKR